MHLSYTTTARDYEALLGRYLEKSVFGRRFKRFAWIAISGLAWLSVVLPWLKFQTFDLGSGLRALLAVMITAGFPFAYEWYSNGVFGRFVTEANLRGMTGPAELTWTADGVECRTPATSAHAQWRDVKGLASTDSHDFIVLAPLLAIVVPATAFPDSAARKLFQADIAARIAAAAVN